MDEIRVSAESIRIAVGVILGDLVNSYGDEILIAKDYFWSIPPDALYDVYERPAELTVGQLSESVEHVLEIAEGALPPVPYSLVWVSDVLRAVGHGNVE
jgi:hypothetical protein